MQIDDEELVPLEREEVEKMASDGRMVDACFVSDDYEVEEGEIINGMTLRIFYGQSQSPFVGVLVKQDGKPRVFKTAEAVMSNAKKMGIQNYRIDASHWKAEYYKPNEAILEYHRRKRASQAEKTSD